MKKKKPAAEPEEEEKPHYDHPILQAIADTHRVDNTPPEIGNMVGAFVAPDGKFIHLDRATNETHPDAIAHAMELPADQVPPDDQIDDFWRTSGAVRIRYNQVPYEGNGISISVPPTGVSEAQTEALQRAVAQIGKSGQIYIERSDVTPETQKERSAFKHFARPSDFNTLLQQIPFESKKEPSAKWIPAAIDAMKAKDAGAIDPRTGKMDTPESAQKDKLTHGVEVFPEARLFRQRLDHPPTAEDLKNFYEENKSEFEKHPELKVGWDKTEDGWEMNVGARGTEEGARYVGNKLNQRAIYDIAKDAPVELGGTGEPPDNLKQYDLEQRLKDLKNPPSAKTPKGSTKELLEKPIPTKGTKEEGLFGAKPSPLHKGIEIKKPVYAEFQKAIGQWVRDTAGDISKPSAKLQRSINIARDEINHWIMENGGEGAGWYRRKTQAAIDVMKERHPSLEDPTKQAIFKAAWVAHSYGNDPDINLAEASQNYFRYEKNGKFDYAKSPEKHWSGHSGNVYTLAKTNHLISTLGEKGAVDFLLTKHPWSEIKDAFKDSDLNVSKKGIALDDEGKAYGAMAFGPKGGAFYLNLNGINDHTTVDVWGARALRRWEGRAGDPDTLTKDEDTGQVSDVPPKPDEIQRFHQVVTNVAKQLGLDGDDVQALQWYYEHKLYEVHGVGEKARDYEQAAKNVIESERKQIEAITGKPVRPGSDAGKGGQPEEGGQTSFFGGISGRYAKGYKGNSTLKQVLGGKP